MFRDKHKDENYFQEVYDFNIKTFERRESDSHKLRILPEYMNRYYSSQSLYSKELVFMAYSLGKPFNEIFKWFKISLHYYTKSFSEGYGLFELIDYLSLAVLFENRKDDFQDDIQTLFDKYMKLTDEDKVMQDDFVDFLAVYLTQGRVVNYHSHFEYLNFVKDDFDSVAKAQKFWYYAHSDAAWYDTHKTEDAYYGYWSFDTAALCKIRGIYDERLKELDYFPYDLLVQSDGE